MKWAELLVQIEELRNP